MGEKGKYVKMKSEKFYLKIGDEIEVSFVVVVGGVLVGVLVIFFIVIVIVFIW